MAKEMKRNVADSFFAGASEEFKKTNINNTHKQQTNTNNGKFDISKPVVETKTKRVNLVLQPSLYKKAQAIADANGVSFNEMIAQILNQIVSQTTESK